MAKKKKPNKSRSIVGDFFVEIIRDGTYPEHIAILTSDGEGIILWNREEAFKLAYKLMSLASEL